MDDYNLWQDLFDTFQSLAQWLKFYFMTLLAMTVLAPMVLVPWYLLQRRRLKLMAQPGRGKLVCTITRNADGELEVYAHDKDATDLIRAQIGLALPDNDTADGGDTRRLE